MRACARTRYPYVVDHHREYAGVAGGNIRVSRGRKARARSPTSDAPLVRLADSFLPELDHAWWKLAFADARAAACFRPHFKQYLILPKHFALRNVGGRGPQVGCDLQELDQWRDVFVGPHVTSHRRLSWQTSERGKLGRLPTANSRLRLAFSGQEFGKSPLATSTGIQIYRCELDKVRMWTPMWIFAEEGDTGEGIYLDELRSDHIRRRVRRIGTIAACA